MRPFTFVAMLFCLSLSFFIIGGGNLYEVGNFKLNGKAAVMTLASSQKKIRGSVADYSAVPLDVEYSGDTGNLVVQQKLLDGVHAQKLLDGGKIPVTYLPKNPHRIIYFTDQLPNPWGWLAAGLVSTIVSLYAVKLLRREIQN
jgi:hypothetical protein